MAGEELGWKVRIETVNTKCQLTGQWELWVVLELCEGFWEGSRVTAGPEG